MVQVVDRAVPPEKRSWPRRSLIALGAALGTAVVLLAALLLPRGRRAP